MPKKTEKARITIACNTCRSRKQKCSGEKHGIPELGSNGITNNQNRPVCKQCFNHNRPCDWPEQLKRGPPKGYVEALEHRLQVAEGVLLRVLSQVSDTQLLNAIPGEQGQNDRGVSYTPLARLEKKGVEDWPQFPLDTAQNIREWQRACIEHDSGDAGNLLEVETRPPIEYEQSRYERKKPWTASRPSESSEVHTGLSMPRRDGKKMAETPFAADQQLYQTPRNVQEATRRVPLDFSTLENREGVQPAQTQNSWSGAPSLNFQERFLW